MKKAMVTGSQQMQAMAVLAGAQSSFAPACSGLLIAEGNLKPCQSADDEDLQRPAGHRPGA